ncbi:hypothetical protein CAPTEDRAFT_219758 [Capitella teleta]|uniref:type I protein arginine methyltransferase n=1 Tax=Capitella teleta TaxID=283909 RepID=R7UFQ0_CAPTE|nr:hypothetical protein CAPTEDRAFT_219758 [Capitella teleta]|eukprot:ELU04923.1 hypothetical protein CAPTEDRAFT_219758 [Capitella teleta]
MAEAEKHLNDSDEEGDEDDWMEFEEEAASACNVLCLFCTETFNDVEAAFSHCKDCHAFSIAKAISLFHLDCFTYIKLVNFIRAEMRNQPWVDDLYMKPVMEDDAFLQFDIDLVTPASSASQAPGDPLLERLREAEIRARVAEEELQVITKDFNQLRSTAQHLVQSQEVVRSDHAVGDLTEDEDDVYFGSYGHFSIHQEMLKDKVRTLSYRDAMYNNKECFKDKVVLDIGCGTGILSMFAATCGAKLVIGVDQSDIIYQAMDIVRENGFDDRVKLLKGRMEDVDLPVEKVDVIVSEWMGYFLLFESMLDTVLWARDHYLKEDGLLLPNACDVQLSLLADSDLHAAQCGYWDNVYGFSMKCMRKCVVREASVAIVKAANIISEPCIVKDLDLLTCKIKDLEFTSPFKLTCSRSGKITAIVGHFDMGFTQCPSNVKFSTSAKDTPTHWKQSVFLLENPLEMKEGEELSGEIVCKKNRKDPRSLMISLSFRNQIINYLMQ